MLGWTESAGRWVERTLDNLFDWRFSPLTFVLFCLLLSTFLLGSASASGLVGYVFSLIFSTLVFAPSLLIGVRISDRKEPPGERIERRSYLG